MTEHDEWGVSASDLTRIVHDNPSLRGMMFGYWKLRQLFENDNRITAVRKDDDHDRRKKGDLVVTYRGTHTRSKSKSLKPR